MYLSDNKACSHSSLDAPSSRTEVRPEGLNRLSLSNNMSLVRTT